MRLLRKRGYSQSGTRSSGGWYDNQPPAYVDYDGLGFRLPMLIISPYAKKNHVSHVPYEHGSILKFV
ncbi:MAG: hypothetical protein JO263_11010, partial [Candidatus Eremiobacteraeota bacterium]|nr:hypothetical protein [Candidatus Eremiobacteraeota bacterium]